MNIAPKKDDEKYYIYKTTNTINGKYYVGFHKTNNPNDSYLGSGSKLIEAINKYGIENFKKEILFEYDNIEEAEAKEREIVNIDFVNDRNTYNVSIGGNVCILYGKENGFYGKTHTQDAKDRMSKAKKGTRYAFNHILKYNGKIFHGYNEFVREKVFKSVFYVRKAIFNGDIKFVDPYMQECLEKSKQRGNKFFVIDFDLMTAKRFADKWNIENGYPEFAPTPKVSKKYEFVKRPSSIVGRKMYWNPKTLKYKYFPEGEEPTGWVKGKPKEAKERDKNKRKPSYEKGTVRAVYDSVGKCHMIPINDPTPTGWYDTRPDFLPKLESKTKGRVMILNDVGNRKFINKDDVLPIGWHFAEVTKDSLTRRKLKERRRKNDCEKL